MLWQLQLISVLQFWWLNLGAPTATVPCNAAVILGCREVEELRARLASGDASSAPTGSSGLREPSAEVADLHMRASRAEAQANALQEQVERLRGEGRRRPWVPCLGLRVSTEQVHSKDCATGQAVLQRPQHPKAAQGMAHGTQATDDEHTRRSAAHDDQHVYLALRPDRPRVT